MSNLSPKDNAKGPWVAREADPPKQDAADPEGLKNLPGANPNTTA